MRINKTIDTTVYETIKDLELIWKQLDDASGSLYNAKEKLSEIDLPDTVVSEADMIDITRIVGLKEQIELLIEEKKKQLYK